MAEGVPKLLLRFQRKAILDPMLSINRTTSVRLNGSRFKIPVWGGMETPGVRYTHKTAIIAAHARSGTFLDVGVNLGQTLLDVRATHQEMAYLGFEPNPACVAYVQRLIEANHFNNCSLVPTALADRPGVAKLYGNHATDHASTMFGDMRARRPVREQYISVQRFDDLGFAGIGFIKIDTEGAELDVLRGMTRLLEAERPTILCEVLPQCGGNTPERAAERRGDLMKFVRDLGYQVLHVPDMQPVDAFDPGPFDRQKSWDYLFTL
jgi:FkbM family methyltransferase